MFAIIGYVVVLICVFGSFIISGGNIEIILHALPHEFMTIGGAGIGAYMIANGVVATKHSLKAVKGVFKGAKWKKQDYTDLLCLMFTLTKLMKTKGMVAIEQHIETPEQSEIFSNYPVILHDHHLTPFICDNIRMFTMDLTDAGQFEDAVNAQIDKIKKEELHSAHAMQTLADGLPALGIVAAVMGVIKTMASIDQPPAILGMMIGSALVGTFLGVLLSYGVVGPMASRIDAVINEELQVYYIIRDMLIAYLRGNPVQICAELGRGNVPTYLQPTFLEVEAALEDVPKVS